MSVQASNWRGNRLLASLSHADFALLEPFLRPVVMKFRQCLEAANRRVETLEAQLKGLRQSDSRANDLGKQTEKLQAELAEVRRISATSIANYEENKQLKASNESLQKQVTQLTERVRELDRNVMLRWLLAGGALVLLGLLIGALIKSRPKRSSWA